MLKITMRGLIYLKLNVPIEKNKDYVINITGMGHNGEGVGKIEGFTVFVDNAVMDEIVEIKIIKIEKHYGIGKLLKIIKASKNRAEPICTIYKKCGGCNIQHMNYVGQLEFKRQRVVDAIARIGKLDNVIIHNTIGMDNPYRYRNKVQLPVGNNNGAVKIGFYAPRSHDIIDMDTCHIQDEAADRISRLIREWMMKFKIEAYSEETGLGSIKHIMIRKAFKTGETMIVIVTNEHEIKNKDELIDMLNNNIENITSVIQNINSKRTNVILGEECITLWGKNTITDYIGNFQFKLSPLSFFQVNPIQTEVLYNKALEYADLDGTQIVFDAYCGAGTISLFLAQRAKKVYGVEIVPEAIENAKENAFNNNITNTEFITGEAEKLIPNLIAKGIKADVVVVDPPRKGCDKALLIAIADMSPKRIVYVSCDPGTLARDLAILDSIGYKTLEILPVDMFPMTAHVECVVKLCRA
jgi:23S rRNA (uracil1939-C5)-methyltransferase